MTAPWLWSGPCSIGLLPGSLGVLSDVQHKIREAWRASLWRSHESSGRRDVTGQPYCSTSARWARDFAQQDVHKFAVLAGAYVSWARFAVMTGDTSYELCPFCGDSMASKDHLWWECGALGRPPGLDLSIMGRGCLPGLRVLVRITMLPVLHFVASVRAKDLAIRYG